MGIPNIPMLVIMALPNGLFFTPSAGMSRSRSAASHEEKRMDGRSSRLGMDAMVLRLFANSLSSPAFMAPARSRSSNAISNTDFRSARSTLTPESSRPPSMAAMKNTSTDSRGMTLLPTTRTLKSGTSCSAWATARPTRCVGVIGYPADFPRSISARCGVASNSRIP